MIAKKKTARNTVFIYPKPIQTKAYADSVTIKRWIEGYDDTQITAYTGLKEDLISVGIAPAKIFSDIGKSGIKRARLLNKDGENHVIKVIKRARNIWEVDITHNKDDLPYSSEKATCTKQNNKDIHRAQEIETLELKPEPWDPHKFLTDQAYMASLLLSPILDSLRGTYELRSSGIKTHHVPEDDIQRVLEARDRLLQTIMSAKVTQVKTSENITHLRLVKA